MSFDLLEYVCKDILNEDDLVQSTDGSLVIPHKDGAAKSELDHILDEFLTEELAPDGNNLSLFDENGLQPQPVSPFSSDSNASSSLSNQAINGNESSSSTTTEIATVHKSCPVCGRPTGKHSYYGGKVCISCRGFFRRSVQNNHYPLFTCTRGKNCSIDSTSRKSCRWCRFEKCVAAGMKVSWVMSEKERMDRVVSRNKTEESALSPLQCGSAMKMHYFMSDDEIMLFKQTHQQYMEFCFLKYCNHFAKNPGDMSMFIRLLQGNEMISSDNVKLFEEIDEQSTKNFGFNLPEMTDLTPFDRMTLLTENFPMVYSLVYGVFCSKYEVEMFFKEFAIFGIRNRKQAQSIDTVVRQLEELNLTEPKFPETFIKESDKAYWESALKLATVEKTNDIRALMRKIEFLMKGNDKLVDRITFILILKLMLFYPDNKTTKLEDPARIESLYLTTVWNLHRYLKFLDEDSANKRLHDLLMLMHWTKEATNLVMKYRLPR